MDLRTNYMGLTLRSPIVVSACTLSEDVNNIVQMEDAGAGAVVLFSLFEEQIRRENELYEKTMAATSNMFAEDYHVGTSQYLELIRRAKERVDIPVIASLNATTPEGWVDYARQMEEAGADALEVNVFWIPADVDLTGGQVEQRYIDIVTEVKKQVRIPVAIKMNPYFSAMGSMALRLRNAGADGLVLFNRFYQPDFDINKLQVLSNLEYSAPNEIRLPLLWIAILYGRVPVSLAATTGVQSAQEVIKYLLAGADVAMTASSLYRHGIGYIKYMTAELQDWMHSMDFKSVEAFKGSMSQQHVSDPSAYERANYIRILESAK
jgi:dihydroorotate dehydrogenase (fumarate)